MAESNSSVDTTEDANESDSPVEITEEARAEAKEMAKSYDDRPTAVLPSSDNTMTGTAVSEWLDDDGNSKFADDSQGSDDDTKADKD